MRCKICDFGPGLSSHFETSLAGNEFNNRYRILRDDPDGGLICSACEDSSDHCLGEGEEAKLDSEWDSA